MKSNSGQIVIGVIMLALVQPSRGTKAECLYVSNSEGASVSVIDAERQQLTRTFFPFPAYSCSPLTMPPIFDVQDAVPDPRTRRIYVTTSRCSVLSLNWHTEETRVLAQFGSSRGPVRAALSSEWNRFFVLDVTSGVLANIDTGRGEILSRHVVGPSPRAMTLAEGGERLFVVGDTLNVVDVREGQIISTFALARRASTVAYAETSEMLFLGFNQLSPAGATLAAVDPTSGNELVARNFPLLSVVATIFGARSNALYVIDDGAFPGFLRVFDPRTLDEIRSFRLPGAPGGLALSDSEAVAYVSIPSQGNVLFVDTLDGTVRHIEGVDCGRGQTCIPRSIRAGTCLDSCPGDCNGDLTVDVAEIVLAVQDALAPSGYPQCSSADRDGDSNITVDEILSAVQSALVGCRL